MQPGATSTLPAWFLVLALLKLPLHAALAVTRTQVRGARCAVRGARCAVPVRGARCAGGHILGTLATHNTYTALFTP